MMKIASLRSLIVAFAVSFVAALPVLAEETPADAIKAKIQQARPDLAIASVKASPAAGLYAVELEAGPKLYATADGDFFVLGDLFAVTISGLVNLSNQERDLERKELMASVDRDEMIIFSPDGEVRASVTVFTDVDCFYCQKLHQEVPALNKAGVEVRYLAYPRAGMGSESFRKIASAWCADDPQEAITQLKARKEIPENVCPGNPVADQFTLGQKVGVSGTPALVLESGELVPGYMPADALVKRIGIN
jgi:thiol:disulfide interchange protein DsbC